VQKKNQKRATPGVRVGGTVGKTGQWFLTSGISKVNGADHGLLARPREIVELAV